MKKHAALILCAAALAGCSGQQVERNLGLITESPDEFTVTTRAPLEIPTDNSLPPPQPGAPRPQEPSTDIAAQEALTPEIALRNNPGADSPGQAALAAAAGPAAPGNIRQSLDKEEKRLNASGGVANTLAFWQSAPPPGKALDARKEAQRLRSIGIPVPESTPN